MDSPADTTPLAALLAQVPQPEPGRRKGALHGSTVAKLRNLIVTGALAPGAKLNERELRSSPGRWRPVPS